FRDTKYPTHNSLNHIITYFFSETFFDYLFTQTNKSIKAARTSNKNLKYLTKEELHVCLSITLYMGVDQLPNIKICCFLSSTRPIEISTKKKRFDKMTYPSHVFLRFHVRLTAYLCSHFKLHERVSKKTSNIIDAINKLRFRSSPPDMHLAIDESTIPHKGRRVSLVYNKTKPNRRGMELDMLCSSEDGYVYRFMLHTGKKTFIFETVNYLTDCYRHHNIHLFIDNFYTTPPLFENLSGKKFFATETCRKNRIGLSEEIKQLCERKISKNKMILFSKAHMNA
ncbi:PiggyBac transposable element-derived protein 4, partial [Cucumispora dikerogammari]